MDAELSPRGPISSPRNGIPGAATAEADLGQEEESAVGSGADRAQADAPRAARVKAWLARSRNRTILGWLAFAVAFAVYVAVQGFPYSEDTVLLWVTAALLVSSLGDLSRWRRGLVRDWLPLYVVLATYALLRGYASHVLWGPFIRPQVAFDNFIGLGVAPTVRLQSLLFNPAHLRPWDYAAWAVYMTHFFVCYVVAGVLWKRDYARFKRFVPLFVGLTFVVYAGYVFYPAIPPWMASQNGYLPVTTRIIPLVWQRIGVHGATALFTHGSEFANNIAAMPSLHAAYPMFLLLFFWRRARTWVRALLVSYVLAMAFTLVYTAEHFVIDELAGWCAAIAVYFVGSRLLDWRRAHVSTGASWSARTRLRRSRLTATPEAQPSALTLPEAPPPG
jgi:hypothetical protein